MRTPSHRAPDALDPPDDAVLKREGGTVVWRELHPDGRPAVAKLYRRRGLWNALRGRLTRFRVEREYLRLMHLVLWAVPCTEPIEWAHGHSREHGHYEVLVMEEVPNAVPLSEFVRELGGEVDLAPLYRMVRRMHESGLLNQTLYPSNVLVKRDAPAHEAYVIADVPRSWVFPRSIAGTPLACYDLLDLTACLQDYGVTVEPSALEAYGLDERDRRWWTRHRQCASRTKGRRLLRDAVARVRWLCAWCALWRRPAQPPSRSPRGFP